MRIQIPVAVRTEPEEQVFSQIFLSKVQSPFQLHLQERLAVHMHCYEIGTAPIVCQSHRSESEVRQDSGEFYEVIVLLLSSSQLAIFDLVRDVHLVIPPTWL